MLAARCTSVTNADAHGLSGTVTTAPGSSIGSVTAVMCPNTGATRPAPNGAAAAPVLHQNPFCNGLTCAAPPPQSRDNCSRHVYISHLTAARMSRGGADGVAAEANAGSIVSMSHATGPGANPSGGGDGSGASGGSGGDGNAPNGSGATSGRSAEPLKRLQPPNGVVATSGPLQAAPALHMLPQRGYLPNSLLLMPPGANYGLQQQLQCLPLLAAAAATMPGGPAGLPGDLGASNRPDCWMQKQMLLQATVPGASQQWRVMP